MGDTVKRMKDRIDASRKAAGEPPRPKAMPLVPHLNKVKLSDRIAAGVDAVLVKPLVALGDALEISGRAVPPKPKKKEKLPIPEPGPDDIGMPYCGPCKRYHAAPASKEDWIAMKCKACNPFPKARKPKSPADRDAAMTQRGRLPDKTTFGATYYADEQRWRGELVIGENRFTDDSSGVHKLLVKLDSLYRAHLAEQAVGEKS